jgi:hypothetical protein
MRGATLASSGATIHVRVLRSVHHHSLTSASLPLPHVTPPKRNESAASLAGLPFHGADWQSTSSRTLAGVLGSPPSRASAQHNVAAASSRQSMLRGPTCVAAKSTGTSSCSALS